ncbi:MAG: tail length tape measure protein [Rhodobacterales bacterium]|nr:MAG: tail length tape measure protein [Rhodobacterales bacterium]
MQEMLRIAALIFCVCAVPVGAKPLAETAPRPLASAIHALQRGDWDRAAALAARDGPAAQELVEWYRLSAGRGSASEVAGFLAAYPNWPGLKRLRRKSEPAFRDAGPNTIIRFFGEEPPQTGKGTLMLARALEAAGEQGEAEANIVIAWRSFDLTATDTAVFLERYGALLAPHHEARMDMALWRGLSQDVNAVRPLVSPGWQALADARLGLKSGARNVNALIEKVPTELQDDPGLAYERFNWRLGKGLGDEAIALLIARSAAGTLGEPARWAGWRRALARQKMREGDAALAYRIATNHGLVEGSAFSDLEWLAGYLSLTYLGKPSRALAHFETFRGAVGSPISLGRAGYWLGRAHEAVGNKEAAMAAYGEGAQYQTSFYGLLAAEKAGVGFDRSLAGREYFPAWQEARFARDMRVRVIELALAMENLTLAEKFMLTLAEELIETGDRKALGQLGNMLEDLDAPHLGVMLGKRAARAGIMLPAPYYALHPMQKMQVPVPMEMSLAIARRESEFDPNVVSGAGAEGLMQLMPGTAREVAQGLALDHDRARVLRDWRYNATLGSAYLAELGARFGGNVIMVAAGYNAGPSRPERWMERFGDPRGGAMDIVDWIEHIPFRETRNYVMRVSESLPIYRARLGRDPLPVAFSRELVGASVAPLR